MARSCSALGKSMMGAFRVGLLAILCAGCTPFSMVRDIAARNPGCLYYTRSQQKVVALTLDDGPDSTTTPQILDALRDNDARATFFLISSRVKGNDALVVRAISESHEIGNHMSRNEASISLTSEEFEESLLEADSVLRRFGSLRWARPGSGFHNLAIRSAMRRHGYQCALGSVYPFDPQLPFAGLTTASVLRTVRPGAVIVLHDGGYKGRNTIKVLPRLLQELRRRGYRVVTLSELIHLP